jgi:hypothetical protein
MAKNERDNLFDLGLGSSLIEIPDASDRKEEEPEPQDNKGKKDQKKEENGIQINDDGSFEIDEFLPKETKESEEEDENESSETDDDNDKKKNKGKTPQTKVQATLLLLLLHHI